jgi:hypothetical protein
VVCVQRLVGAVLRNRLAEGRVALDDPLSFDRPDREQVSLVGVQLTQLVKDDSARVDRMHLAVTNTASEDVRELGSTDFLLRGRPGDGIADHERVTPRPANRR